MHASSMRPNRISATAGYSEVGNVNNKYLAIKELPGWEIQMNKQHNKGSTAGKLIAVVQGNLIDVILRLAGLNEAVSMVSHTVDIPSVTQQIAGLMI